MQNSQESYGLNRKKVLTIPNTLEQHTLNPQQKCFDFNASGVTSQ